MQKFSIEKALTSGFRLIQREWGSVLAWGAVYVLAIIAMELVIFGPVFVRMIGQGGNAQQEMMQMMESLGQGRMVATLGLAYLVVAVAGVVLYGAIIRAHLRPDERRGFYLRLSARELWMGLTALVIVIFIMVLSFAGAMAIVMIGGALGSGGGGLGLLAIPIGIAVVVGCIYLALRFSMAWLIAWDEKRFSFFESWRLTKGQGWRMVLLYLAIILVLLVATVALMLVMLAIGFVVGLAASATAGDGVGFTVIRVISAIIMLPLYAGLLGAGLAIAASPWVEVYRALRPAAGESLADVF